MYNSFFFLFFFCCLQVVLVIKTWKKKGEQVSIEGVGTWLVKRVCINYFIFVKFYLDKVGSVVRSLPPNVMHSPFFFLFFLLFVGKFGDKKKLGQQLQ